MDRLWAVECHPSPKLSRRDPPVGWTLHLGLLHIQRDSRLPECPLPCVCGPPTDQGIGDTHPGETEPQEVGEQPGVRGLHAENLETRSLYLLTCVCLMWLVMTGCVLSSRSACARESFRVCGARANHA